VDLLDPAIEDQYRIRPNLLKQQVEALSGVDWIILDEVQKLPKLLDVAHQLIENKKIKFIGSRYFKLA